jgi:hypothetical protein
MKSINILTSNFASFLYVTLLLSIFPQLLQQLTNRAVGFVLDFELVNHVTAYSEGLAMTACKWGH